MKLMVKSDDKRFRLWIPAWILKWKWLWRKGYQKMGIDEFNKEAINKLYKEFKKVKRYFKGLELVHVESSDGDKVIIKL